MLRSPLVVAFWLISSACASSLISQVSLSESLSDKWSWQDCGLETDPVRIQNIDISPDPPLPGEPLTISVTGTANERIEDGAQAEVTVKLGIIKLLQKTFDVCEEARKANASVQCPVEKGKYVVEQTVNLPKEIPPAKFQVDVQGYTVDDADMLCLHLTIDFQHKLLW